MQMNTIRFSPLEWDTRTLELNVATESKTERLVFEFEEPTLIEEDSLAIALSTLCGTVFDEINFDFAVSDDVAKGIGDWTQSEVFAESGAESTSYSRDNGKAVLNFSGGLDSLASYFLLGDPVLVSLDLGGRFSREKAFFQRFDTHTIRTNLIETDLRYNSWSFMGIGPLLLADQIKAQYFSFGSILEAGQLHLKEPAKGNFTFPPFRMAGFTNAAPVAGISEAGTVLTVLAHRPDLLAESLYSLANPGEEKFFRKIALARVVAERSGLDLELPALPVGQRVHYTFGQNFAVDLTALFFKACGRGDLAEGIVSDSPSLDHLGLVDEDFDFMLRADPNYYAAYPRELFDRLESALDRSGIEWYEDSHFESVEKVREALSDLYQF
ncbi:hypothetical protein JKI95_09970 [Corynebacterium aquatimens]|uniref:hypothetical protein n=1 Tax=Corynebacterium TaxID=1716 RepID=UPI001F249C20|nr:MULTISPECIES: hypothetical protein [Corynebacterium]QYH19412.1 hypothetical protein JKI95_09970 [Corynebacterium aquatimens]UIZ91668.1 hypothetical protein JZY91_07965 [Corynebacterium sp. CNCTC7651]